MTPGLATLATWAIAAAATAGVIVRPFKLPEAVWAVAGAAVLIAAGLLSWPDAAKAVGKGLDVYLFLTGMMLLSETARREGVFDWIAAHAVTAAAGSRRRLFALIYLVGIVVTALLSNDATAVVLTPAVFAAARKAKADPLPYLFICAFVANAASFVLPISNPANIVVFAGHTPALGAWLARFALPSVLAIAASYAVLRLTQGRALAGACEISAKAAPLSASGWISVAGIGLTGAVLLAVSALDLPLGAPTCALGLVTTGIALARDPRAAGPVLKGVSWSVLPLVAGLFVLVEALDRTGVTGALAGLLRQASANAPIATAASAGGLVALASNLINNLPAGLIAATTVAQAHPPAKVVDALLIGVDLGPNLSVTGSLATILWLTAIRRDGEAVGFWRFLKLGVVMTPPALALAIGARLLGG